MQPHPAEDAPGKMPLVQPPLISLYARAMKAALVALTILALACSKKTKWYDTQVAITRVDAVRKDAQGKARDVDVEFTYPDCPGEQVEIIRGDAAFAQCLSKYKVGDKVPVRIEYHWLEEGYWDWDIHEMGGCKRPPDPEDTASFDTVQECEPITVNGVEEGFVCNRLPQKALLAKCPWFGRR